MACYQSILTTVHSSIKMVTAAIKGFEAVTGEFQELIRQVRAGPTCESSSRVERVARSRAFRAVRSGYAHVCLCFAQLSSNEVPRLWARAGPGGIPVEMASESIGAWVGDLTDRLEWLYQWAVEGPPLVWRLGMMARPKAFLTAIQQVRASFPAHGRGAGSSTALETREEGRAEAEGLRRCSLATTLQIHAARLDCAVGSLVWRTHILTIDELPEQAASAGTDAMKSIEVSARTTCCELSRAASCPRPVANGSLVMAPRCRPRRS